MESEVEEEKEDATTWREEMKRLAMASAGFVLVAGGDEKLRMVKTLGLGALPAYVAVKVASLHCQWNKALNNC